MSITHSFVSSKPDGADTSLIRPVDWNAGHVITGVGGGLYANVILNGNFDVWQLGETFASAVHRQIVADRFVFGQSAGAVVCTVSQDTDVPDVQSQYSLEIEITTEDATLGATDEMHIKHALEGYDMKKLKGKTCTLSFWVKSSLAGIYCIAFVGAIDGTNVTQVKEYTINAANTWEKKTIPIVFDYTSDTDWNYTNGQGLKIRFTLRAGSSFQTTSDTWNTGNFLGTSNQVDFGYTLGGVIRFAKIQLNEGSSALDYFYRHRVETLSLCKRYLQVISADVAGVNCGSGLAPSADTCNFDFSCESEMRTAPEISAKGTIAVDYDAQTPQGVALVITALTNYSRSKSMGKFSVTKVGGFTAGSPYWFRLITTSGKLVFNADFDLV